MGWLGHGQKYSTRVEGSIGFLHYVFPAPWKEVSVPSQADLHMVGAGITVLPLRGQGGKLESFDKTQLEKVAGILETPSLCRLTAPCLCSRC